MKRLFGNVALVLCSLLISLTLVNAEELKEARVTQVVKDVKLLPQQAAPRPATIRDLVREGTAVRTGAQSRSELTFNDLTITRLGANTIFSFEEGTRMMDLRDGAVLFQVPKGSGGATIRTAAVTAAITGTTGIGEFHPAGAGRSRPFSKWLCLEGRFHLILPNGQKVELGPGKLVTTDGENFSKVMDFDIGQVMNTSLLVSGYDTPLASLSLIQLEQEKQLASTRTPITNTRLLDPANIINVVDQGIAAQESPTVTPTPSSTPSTPTPTPSTPTPTPGKFGELTVIASSDPYIITGGTTIQTDPTITTNGQTDFGKIYRGPAQDGPLSEFVFGSTSAFDTASAFDTELDGQMGAAVFKFTSLQLTGDPTISTANGPVNLGLIAVDGITSGGPGGELTFAGIRGLLLATQNGSINLGPEISFSGLHDITFYARGSGSLLTLASDVSTTDKIRLYGEGGMQLSSNLSTQDLIAFTSGDFDFTAGSINAETISIISGGDLTFSLGTPLSFNTKAFRLRAEGNIHVNDSLEIIEDSLSPGADLNISLVAASQNILVEGDLSLTTNPSDVITGANIVLTSGGNTIIGGALTLLANSANGGQIGTDAKINVNADSIATDDFLDVEIDNFDAGHIGRDALINVAVANNTTSQSDMFFNIFNEAEDTASAGFIGRNAIINLGAASISGGFFDLEIVNDAGGHIGGNALIRIQTPGNFTTQDGVFIEVTNRLQNTDNVGSVGGNIVGDARVNFSAGNVNSAGFFEIGVLNNDFRFLNGAGEIGGDASIVFSAGNASATDFFNLVINNFQGSIGGAATVNAQATNISTDDVFFAHIINGDGEIGDGASVLFALTGTLNAASDAIFEILNDNGLIGGDATIAVSTANLTAGNLLAHIDNDGKSSIGGNATINMNVSGSATVTSDAILEILGSDGAGGAAININGGSYGAGGTFRTFIDGDGTIAFDNASVNADVLKIGALGANGVLNIGGGTLSADTTLKLYASGSNGQLNFISNVTLGGNSAKILAANSVTILDNVVVTIGGTNPADVFTNNANYSEEFGGNDSTTGTFAGAGANQPQPLPSAPPFDDSIRPPAAGSPATSSGHPRTPLRTPRPHSRPPSATHVTSKNKPNGDLKIGGRKPTGPAIKVSDSGQLLSLLEGAPDTGGKITVAASTDTRKKVNSGPVDGAARSNANRGTMNAPTGPPSQGKSLR